MLLVVPGLIPLAMLMCWLEVRLTHRLVAHDVETAWQSSLSADELEEAISRSVAKILPALHHAARS